MGTEQINERNAELNIWIESIANEDTKLYIKNRVLKQMAFFSEKSQKCKSSYFKWTNASIIISFLIPVISIFSDGSIIMKAVIAALGASIAAITSHLSIHNYKNLWETYRSVRENTYSLLLFYFTSSGIFANEKQEDQDKLLIESCENIFRDEQKSWVSIISSTKE